MKKCEKKIYVYIRTCAKAQTSIISATRPKNKAKLSSETMHSLCYRIF